MTILNVSFSLEIGTLILAVVFLTPCIVLLLKNLCKRKRTDYIISNIEISPSPHFTLSLDNSDRQIAYKVWVEINTRTIAVKIDLDKDNIKVINDSFYSCFLTTREIIKEISVNKLKKRKKLVDYLIYFLNGILRPYLTKWGVYYKEWYELAQKENSEKTKLDKRSHKTFIEIQREFPEYDALCKELLDVNKKIIIINNELYKIAFNVKEK